MSWIFEPAPSVTDGQQLAVNFNTKEYELLGDGGVVIFRGAMVEVDDDVARMDKSKLIAEVQRLRKILNSTARIHMEGLGAPVMAETAMEERALSLLVQIIEHSRLLSARYSEDRILGQACRDLQIKVSHWELQK